MSRRGGRTVSPLRAARLARNATQEEIVAELDTVSLSGSSGVTASMLSGWELGKHVTSVRYRKMLCDLYGQTPDVLFAHQDEELATADGVVLLVGHRDLRAAMLRVVEDAEEILMVTGSRSRDPAYLDAMETVLAHRPALAHYRVLFGAPHRQILKDHLLRLLAIRDPDDRTHGYKTLHIGLVEDQIAHPERFLCVSEKAAVVPIPSLTSAEAFDSGVLLGASPAARLVDHARQCYAAAVKVETAAAVRALPVRRPGGQE
ncbi:helix-turn-helix transcriptional regulator [Frankia sp. Cppng1_Ct_nod]|uniref:helix-turn-helix domain-containing protein n=1 Tax=Frankia sp. Cppng1_Ct_nod TaxID=2897162 RepID=UPI001041972C|nr:helix-turn-helix transcriptional regulator [Frankia sp. Cppng1_Ct_nod]